MIGLFGINASNIRLQATRQFNFSPFSVAYHLLNRAYHLFLTKG